MRRLLLTILPKVLLSRTTGLVTRIPLPRWLRRPLFGWFARRYGVDAGEAARPLVEYRSFAELFGRELRDGARPLADAPLVAPCDGAVVNAGRIAAGRIPEVKGRSYAVAELLAGLPDVEGRFDDGDQCTLYLAPGDYHRLHWPCDGRLTAWSYVPGRLYPVNPPAVRAIPGLFPGNERVSLLLEDTPLGTVAVVPVAALNVGDIAIHALPELRTNAGRARAAGRLEPAPEARRGAELGSFHFGSTVILLFEPGRIDLAGLEPETRVRVGQALGRPLGTAYTARP